MNGLSDLLLLVVVVVWVARRYSQGGLAGGGRGRLPRLAIVDAMAVDNRRKLVLDFEKVQYLSSQAIGIILTLNKKMAPLKYSKLILCGVGPKLMELLKITRLDRILTIKPTQQDAVKVFDQPL